jgi:hypothetical protein
MRIVVGEELEEDVATEILGEFKTQTDSPELSLI